MAVNAVGTGKLRSRTSLPPATVVKVGLAFELLPTQQMPMISSPMQAPTQVASKKTRLLIVASPLGTGGLLSSILKGEASLAICAVCPANKAIVQTEKLHPGLVLIDASQSGRDWRQLVRSIRSTTGSKVVVLSSQQSPGVAAQMLEAGADGFVTLDEMDQIGDVLIDVLNSSSYVSEAVYFTGAKEATSKRSQIHLRR